MSHPRCLCTVAIVLAAVVGAESAFGQIRVADELFVDLDAAEYDDVTGDWPNNGTLGDFANPNFVPPIKEDVGGATAVTFDGAIDALQQGGDEVAPEGLVGPDPTRSIEAWVFNPAIANEETIVSWGRRGGPNGSNMSFNYGTNTDFGAVGHWGGPDIGWGEVPRAGQWHHLVYTYDGTTTTVYADGRETNSEVLGAGAINTHANTKITIASQLDSNGVTLTANLKGSLSIGRLRIHDGVLSPEDVEHNFNEERDDFPVPGEAAAFVNAPLEDSVLSIDPVYVRTVEVAGEPEPEVTALAPGDATVERVGALMFRVTVPIPDPAPASIRVALRAENEFGIDEVEWIVDLRDPEPPPEGVEVAEQLFVNLDAVNADTDAGIWLNNGGRVGDFTMVGQPFVEDVDGVTAVSFFGAEAFVSANVAPDGIIGPDPTRSIEAWVFNPDIAGEETIVSWGKRGGPAGSNMSFNYGVHGSFGAIGHWGGPDIGWDDAGGAPAAGEWHHLVYTYDGETTRVYADGSLSNEESLGLGVINTHGNTRVAVGSQWESDGVTLTEGLRGSLSIARLRVHDGVLSAEDVLNNFLAEQDDFVAPDPPTILDAPLEDRVVAFRSVYRRSITVEGTPPFEVEAEPEGSTVTATTAREFLIEVPIPVPPASFDVTVTATNEVGDTSASWTVDVLTATGGFSTAGELFVDLDAADMSAGSDSWLNNGTLGGAFTRIGEPMAEVVDGVAGVSFDGEDDAYASEFNAPAGLVGLDPTRSVEAWVFNPAIANEETILSWGKRGGPDGSNMSFNYGTNTSFGAVGHWGGADIGWGEVPPAGEWHHLVYTYDGTTTRVYADGLETNSEELGPGAIDTATPTQIVLASQLDSDGVTLTGGLKGSLSLARVRIHDDVLTPEQVINNLFADADELFGPAGVPFVRGDGNADGDRNISDASFILNFLFLGGPPPTCLASIDVNDDGDGNISDASFLLNWLFLGGRDVPAPNACGEEPLASEEDCASFAPCQ